MFSEFTRTLNDSSIKSFVRPIIEISPVIKLLKELGPTSELSVKNLTAKLSWLLAVTGFFRAIEIHRIDYGRSRIVQGVLHLVI
ncbi:hypothetical protein AYI69_g4186 [Smittium culicis]|uniref:Uncharacterized protein n=1 Tax=Smittium culicis TaxID=133412 RepID=A0A1R1YFR0_9FUNG|nr:hypothetical protein AYI69_g4186 [Smittium culicis]